MVSILYPDCRSMGYISLPFVFDTFTAFITIGKIAIQVKSNMGPYLDATLSCIKETLMVKG